MTSLYYMLISSLVGGAGWYLGEFWGMGAAFIGSTVGSIVGLWWAYKFQRGYLE